MSDAALHAAIRDAAAAGRVGIDVVYARANRNGAPGYRTTDVVVPWFVATALSAYVGASYGVASGAALFVVLAGLIVVALRPYNRRRALERYRAAALASAENFTALWGRGALVLHAGGQAVAAPDGDWRALARSLADGRPAGEAA